VDYNNVAIFIRLAVDASQICVDIFAVRNRLSSELVTVKEVMTIPRNSLTIST